MGVPGLWNILRPAGTPRSLTDIAVNDGYASKSPPRAFRVGIDASIWFIHAEYGKEGENPELRTIFFRLTRLLQVPFLPLFVFDGPLRPEMKRGKLIDTKPNWMVEGLKNMIDAFGFEWRMAPGEAEAELAYLNHIGVIDAVLTDDVDTLVFGAKMIIRNQSKNLTGNKAHAAELTNADGRDDKNHTMTFAADDIQRHPHVQLTQAGLILIALLSGGDYDKGMDGCGPTVSAGLAQCGFGESLITKVRSLALSVSLSIPSSRKSRTRLTLSPPQLASLNEFLLSWRAELCTELRTNKSGKLGKKYAALAKRIEQNNWLPPVEVLLAYVCPVTSEERAIARALAAKPHLHSGSMDPAKERELSELVKHAKTEVATSLRGSITWPKDPDVGAIARVCEARFEWGVQEIIVKRFRSWLWSGIVCRMLRRAKIVMDSQDRGRGQDSEPTPSQQAAQLFQNLFLSSPSKRHRLNPSSSQAASSQHQTSSSASSQLTDVVRKIHSTRTHASTDGLLEYRLEVDPAAFVRAVEEGIEGTRQVTRSGWTSEEDGGMSDEDDELPSLQVGQGKKKTGATTKKKAGKAKETPTDVVRMWMPASMVEPVLQELVKEFEDRKAKRGRGKAKATGAPKATTSKGKPKAKGKSTAQDDESDASEEETAHSVPTTPRKRKARAPTFPLSQARSEPGARSGSEVDYEFVPSSRPGSRNGPESPSKKRKGERDGAGVDRLRQDGNGGKQKGKEKTATNKRVLAQPVEVSDSDDDPEDLQRPVHSLSQKPTGPSELSHAADESDSGDDFDFDYNFDGMRALREGSTSTTGFGTGSSQPFRTSTVTSTITVTSRTTLTSLAHADIRGARSKPPPSDTAKGKGRSGNTGGMSSLDQFYKASKSKSSSSKPTLSDTQPSSSQVSIDTQPASQGSPTKPRPGTMTRTGSTAISRTASLFENDIEVTLVRDLTSKSDIPSSPVKAASTPTRHLEDRVRRTFGPPGSSIRAAARRVMKDIPRDSQANAGTGTSSGSGLTSTSSESTPFTRASSATTVGRPSVPKSSNYIEISSDSELDTLPPLKQSIRPALRNHSVGSSTSAGMAAAGVQPAVRPSVRSARPAPLRTDVSDVIDLCSD